MPFGHNLYAVVSRSAGEKPAAPKRGLTEIKREKLVALKQKKLIDRANILVDRLEARQAALDERIGHLQHSKQCAAARAALIEARIVEEMEAWGLTAAEGFRTRLQLAQAPPSVDVFDTDLLPAEYWRQPKVPAKQPDKTAIKSALTKKKKVPGARLVQGTSLRRS